MLKNLPADYNDIEVREMVAKLGGPNPKTSNERGMTVPLNIFLYQEVSRMQRVIGLVRKTLQDTILAIDGQIIMTPDILDAINSIFDAKVIHSFNLQIFFSSIIHLYFI